jgi:hypothetical protein
MFGFSRQTATKTWSQPGGGDELAPQDSAGFVFSFEPYPEMSAPQPEGEWRSGEPQWASDTWGDDIDESDPQPGYDDQDYDDQDYDD